MIFKTDFSSLNIDLPPGMYLAETQGHLDKVVNFRKSYFDDGSENVRKFHDDGLDKHSYVFFYLDENDEVIGTIRLLLDIDGCFPEELIYPSAFQEIRKKGLNTAEMGRFLITKNSKKLLPCFYGVIYKLSRKLKLDNVLIVMKQKNLPSHEKIMPIEEISENIGCSWDQEKDKLSLISWDIKKKQPYLERFYEKGLFSKPRINWDDYSKYHMGVCVSVQHELYNNISKRAKGKVLDVGCGSGRFMGYIKGNEDVTEYCGIDPSSFMIDVACDYKRVIGYGSAKLLVEEGRNHSGLYDTIFSNMSYYCWSDKKKNLTRIFNMMNGESVFFLSTPNSNFNKNELSKLVLRDAFGNPYLERFLEINLDISDKYSYPEVNELVSEVMEVGFRIVNVNSSYFLGGVTCLELKRL